MPQLEFTWWVLNFFLVWIAVLSTLIIILSIPTLANPSQSTELPNLPKTHNTWQWS
uniref:ATP synthase complex subunit 8 n=1 Tax=Pygmaeocidaris prionigera TaxID=2803191 RepID=A0A886RKG5_9ECHN|nr:ATP synthase F0 subunit 8 [Pygmaeocidaris prionigera]QQV69851.1 ATP synthase F0 subunit 8 [Pygmaeocidaris prionigera]